MDRRFTGCSIKRGRAGIVCGVDAAVPQLARFCSWRASLYRIELFRNDGEPPGPDPGAGGEGEAPGETFSPA